MELHEDNAFKIKGYQSAITAIERGGVSLDKLDSAQLQELPGIGKSIAEAIIQIRESGTHPFLEGLLEKTPQGILELLKIKGLGPKKIKTLWKELEITSTHELMEACQSGQVAKIKGFGEKTQESIIQKLEFNASNKGKWLFADIDDEGALLMTTLKKVLGNDVLAPVGSYGKMAEIVDDLTFLIGTDNPKDTLKKIGKIEELHRNDRLCSPFRWQGEWKEMGLQVILLLAEKDKFIRKKLLLTSSPSHLLHPVEGTSTLGEYFYRKNFTSEEEAYTSAGMPYIPADLREGNGELEWAQDHSLDELLTLKDLKGPLHNHSTYSDGKNKLEDLAAYCKSAGYEYLGIADHSRSAFYANGLDEDRIRIQHEEIDRLNESLAPFRIFKGIESDILTDGSLDYSAEVLASFDYIVASIHSGLSMDSKKATERLIRAIQNPHTTILGHPTGRLLLRREGYPIDHRAVIDACAHYQVVIEINANPWRLDLDWHWVRYAMEQGVTLSINPDAHENEGINDMKYGVIVGRKGGLTKDMTLNTKSAEDLNQYFQERKKNKL
ncbi:helix-hairpin-helix domain-containing protein [Cyclobacterium jeungdonense]|uniref:Helix-hairpin-helix domain-containing protein n=2 Tax=Cyclobacterium jeungdonense TaxID=708087 RepID=A0ABT8C805_9BACT|nr:helix-hairpin-helix domain-containing protein [Cyclobacterium jeungdonense]MDN3688197.1 helix-hairpin-helix domain-containing protein [Cyclobacterium jeungdonense]